MNLYQMNLYQKSVSFFFLELQLPLQALFPATSITYHHIETEQSHKGEKSSLYLF